MKIKSRKFEKDGAGEIKLTPTEEEDMWHLYNILAVGDSVTSMNFRKVTKESTTGSVSTKSVRVLLTLQVKEIFYDSQTGQIRLRGINISENPYVKMGAYHTTEIVLQKQITIHKDCWDTMYLERLDQAADVRNIADAAAIIMQQGMAHLCLITPSMTVTRAKIEVQIPRKRYSGTSGHEKAVNRFYEGLLDAILRHIKFDVVKVIVVASPAYVNEEFLKYLFDQAIKRDLKVITDNRGKFLCAHSSSGERHALNEVLEDPTVAKNMSSTKAFEEVAALDRFFKTLNEDADRALYGVAHVVAANENKAIDTLLITDDLFRNADLKKRKEYVKLVESVRENGGNVHIFSAMHVTGEHLTQMSGIAAVLRFPIKEEALGIDDSSDEEEEEKKEDTVVIPTISPAQAAEAAAAHSGIADAAPPGATLMSPKQLFQGIDKRQHTPDPTPDGDQLV